MCTQYSSDDLLYPLLDSETSITNFFDRIFEFLYRRTDFFKVKCGDSQNLGLEAGQAESILWTVFNKYQNLVQEEQCHTNTTDTTTDEPVFIDYVKEETVVTSSSGKENQILSCHDVQEETVVASSNGEGDHISSCVEKRESQSQNVVSSKRPEDTIDVKIPFMDPDSYNGARCDKYSWAQSIKDVDIRLKVPEYVISGKQVCVSLSPSALTIKILTEGEWTSMKSGDLPFRINLEESTWTLIPKEYVHVCLQKAEERWWDCAWVGEPKINLREIDSTIPYDQLDHDSQTKIEELMYNEHMKRIGKPTVRQNKLNSILKEAWDADASPFKGQAFDPSVVEIQN